MKDQHKLIKGYRDLNEDEISLINRVKAMGPDLETLINDLRSIPDIDQRWLEIGVTHFQEGSQALIRSIAKPESFI